MPVIDESVARIPRDVKADTIMSLLTVGTDMIVQVT
jgi:hypothetical protein